MVFDTRKEAEQFISKRKKGIDKLIKETKSDKDITTAKNSSGKKLRINMLEKAKKDLKIRKRKFKDGSTLYFVD